MLTRMTQHEFQNQDGPLIPINQSASGDREGALAFGIEEWGHPTTWNQLGRRPSGCTAGQYAIVVVSGNVRIDKAVRS